MNYSDLTFTICIGILFIMFFYSFVGAMFEVKKGILYLMRGLTMTIFVDIVAIRISNDILDHVGTLEIIIIASFILANILCLMDILKYGIKKKANS